MIVSIDVRGELVIPLPPVRVAGYAMDWRHDAEWTQGIRTTELSATAEDGGFGPGAELTRTAYFLGRRLDYVLRVMVHEPPTLLELKSVAGPFPTHLTYRFDEHPDGTLASIRLVGEPSGYYRVGAAVARLVMRSRIRRGLRELSRNLS